MKSDIDLLRSYVGLQSGEAFTEIVRRNVGLVHACILRRVGGDAHLAEDVTQKVFSDLARKAPKLTALASLSGWLYVSATLASAEAVRKERRRKVREMEASRMDRVLAHEGAQTWEEWSRIRNLLDDLVCGLNQDDRDAVVLRFFSKRTYPEIAWDQGTTEEGARKRVERALEKLRLRLTKAGVTSSMEALEAVLAKQPEGEPARAFADRVAGIALVEFGAGGAATSWLLSLARVMTSRAAATGLVFVATALVVGWQHRRNAVLEAQISRRAAQAEQIRQLEDENRRLTHAIFEAEDLRRTLAVNPAPPASPDGGAPAGGPAAAPLNVNVTADGRIRWEGEPVTLEGYLDRLVASHAQDPSSEARLIVQGEPGVEFSAAAYVVEQASKAGFHDIVINSTASPGATDNWVTMPSSPALPGDKTPPTLPDVAAK